ncbi:MAG: L-threonylcarbamoyladenylate synthase [Candidatus Peribacteraceae bacterium]|nr:L-threonylcarbamoyladenylate synthase [Candidatus Peribacteraceae bacterium]
MKILPVSDAAIAEALEVLRDGGIVGHATETCYGFACDLTNRDAVTNLFILKARPFDQPVSGLFSSLEEAKKYVVWNDRAKELAMKHLPGPLTLVLPMNPHAPMALSIVPTTYNLQPTPSLGLRVSSHPLAMKLAAGFGKPLSTTSANLHGKPNPYGASDIAAQFEGEAVQPDLILDSGTLPPTPPSTVINLTNGGGVLRKGTL